MNVKTRTKSEEKRQLILDAAVELFTEFGYQSTSMDKIAKQAGVSKQTLYSHFGNKEELFSASISTKCIRFELTDEVFATLPDPVSFLPLVADRFRELILSDDAVKIHKVCVSEAYSQPQVSRLYFEAGPDRLMTAFTNYLAEMDRIGKLKVTHPRWAAGHFFNMVMGEAWLKKQLNIPFEEDDQARTDFLADTVECFLKAYSL